MILSDVHTKKGIIVALFEERCSLHSNLGDNQPKYESDSRKNCDPNLPWTSRVFKFLKTYPNTLSLPEMSLSGANIDR